LIIIIIIMKLLWRKRRKRDFDHPCYLPFGASCIAQNQWWYWSTAGVCWVMILKTGCIHECSYEVRHFVLFQWATRVIPM